MLLLEYVKLLRVCFWPMYGGGGGGGRFRYSSVM
jgi:hypothetical protein